MWRSPPLIPALKKQRQEELCEFQDSQIYTEGSRTVRATERICPFWFFNTGFLCVALEPVLVFAL